MRKDFVWSRCKKTHDTQKCHGLLEVLAECTGLEPATPDVTGRYSNQLNYHSARIQMFSQALARGNPHFTECSAKCKGLAQEKTVYFVS